MQNTEEIISNSVDLIAKKDFEQAQVMLENFVARNPENQEALKNLGLCYLNLDNFEFAAKIFLKLVKIDKDDAGAIFYLASCYDKLGEVNLAVKNYKKVIKLREEFYDAYKKLCVLYITQGQFELAAKLAAKAIKKNKEDYQFFYFLSTALISKGDTLGAIENLKLAVALKPDHQQILNNLGSCYLGVNEFAKAQEVFETAYDVNPDDSLTNYNLGTIFQIKEEYKRALNYFNEAYKIQPSIMILTSLAYCAMLAEDYELGAKLYRNLVALHPEKLNFQKNLLTCLIEIRNIPQAIGIAQNLVKLNPKSDECQKKLAFLYRINGQHFSAMKILDDLLKRGKIQGDVYYEHALCALKLEDLDTAKTSFKKVIQLEPDNAAAHKDLGMLYLYLNLVDWAQEEIQTALDLEPNDHYNLFAYATLLNRMNDYENADIYYRKAIEAYPESADYLTYRGINLVRLHKIDEAVTEFKKALEIEGDYIQARFTLAQIYFSQKKYEPARQLLGDIVNTPNNAEIINLLAKIEVRLKNYESAATLFEKLYEVYPKNHLLMTDLAKCYLKLGNTERAKDLAVKALEIFSDFSDALKILKEAQKMDGDSAKTEGEEENKEALEEEQNGD